MNDVIPELKQIVGSMLLAAKQPVSAAHLRKVFVQLAKEEGNQTAASFAEVKEEDVRQAVLEIKADLERLRLGFSIGEVADGYRVETDVASGPWIRQMLEKGKPNRLSQAALESLAIIAYRQPCTRAQIEAVRGVAVDQVIRTLMELELVKIIGRSELPGHPLLLGTTQKFLEHFGLKNVDELPSVAELRRIDIEQSEAQATAAGEGAVSEAVAEEGAGSVEAVNVQTVVEENPEAVTVVETQSSDAVEPRGAEETLETVEASDGGGQN